MSNPRDVASAVSRLALSTSPASIAGVLEVRKTVLALNEALAALTAALEIARPGAHGIADAAEEVLELGWMMREREADPEIVDRLDRVGTKLAAFAASATLPIDFARSLDAVRSHLDALIEMANSEAFTRAPAGPPEPVHGDGVVQAAEFEVPDPADIRRLTPAQAAILFG